MITNVTHTQLPVPAQASLLTTPLTESGLLRVMPDVVAPTLPDYAIPEEYKGKRAYLRSSRSDKNNSSAGLTSPDLTENILSVPIPARLSTSIASFGSDVIFAAHLLAQDEQQKDNIALNLLADYEFFAAHHAANSKAKNQEANTSSQTQKTHSLFASFLHGTVSF